MKRRLSILFAMVAATVITALAHTSHVLGNGAVGIDYEYNLRGWTTNITSSVFSQQIHYHDVSSESEPCFNGNISATEWLQGEVGNQLIKTGGFSYYYDELDRLVAANFRDHSERDFSCQYEYDIQGNATRVSRYGITDRIDAGGTTSCSYGVIDDVTLTYNGNQLVCADDAADALVYAGAMDFHDGANEQTEYAYDANGNLTKDLNRGIESITYDRNNMPTEITFASGARTCYTYDADGRKLRVSHYGRRGEKRDELDYIGDMVLRNGALERTLTPNGYIVNDTVYYYVKDYQGNVRSVVREDGAVVESNEYYPYGGLFTASPSVQPYKYGAKELDRTHGLDWYDSKARWVNPMSGMTSTMDRLAEKYYHLSPYLWCGGNPIKNIDENGDSIAILCFQHKNQEHIALLIQDENNKWRYYSVNGDVVWNESYGLLGLPHNDLGERSFESPSDFLNSDYNTEGSYINGNINTYGYDVAFIVPSNYEQDKNAIKSFTKSSNARYNVFTNNCATAVKNTINETFKTNIKSWWPSSVYNDIKKIFIGKEIKK